MGKSVYPKGPPRVIFPVNPLGLFTVFQTFSYPDKLPQHMETVNLVNKQTNLEFIVTPSVDRQTLAPGSSEVEHFFGSSPWYKSQCLALYFSVNP